MPNAFRPGDNQTQDYNQMWQTAPAALPDKEKQFWKSAANLVPGGPQVMALFGANTGLSPENSQDLAWQGPPELPLTGGKYYDMSQPKFNPQIDPINRAANRRPPSQDIPLPEGHLAEMEAINRAYHNAKRMQPAEGSSPSEGMQPANRNPISRDDGTQDTMADRIPLYQKNTTPDDASMTTNWLGPKGYGYSGMSGQGMGNYREGNDLYWGPSRAARAPEAPIVNPPPAMYKGGTHKVAGMDPYKYATGIQGSGNRPNPNSPPPMDPSQIAQVNSPTLAAAPSMPTGGPLSGNPNAKSKIQQATELNEKKLELEDAKIQAYKMSHNLKAVQDSEMFEIKKAQELMELAQGNGSLGTMEIISIG